MPSFAFHPGFGGNSIRSNPWDPTQILVTAADNFGISGTGKVYVIRTGDPQGRLELLAGLGTNDGAFDACFSEVDGEMSTVLVACGDGVKVFKLDPVFGQQPAIPVSHLAEHSAEVSTVTWAHGGSPHFATASWDRTVKVWPAMAMAGGPSLCTINAHMKEVYDVAWAPHQTGVLATCSGDGSWKLWDVRRPQQPAVVSPGPSMVMSIDWNRYDGTILATGSVDHVVKLFDMRKPQQPLAALKGHQGSVRRVRFSPHNRTALISAGYDFRVCSWDLQRPQRPLTARYEQHREFVVGLDWNYNAGGGFFSASWDGTLHSCALGMPPTATHMMQPPLPPMPSIPRPPNASTLMRVARGPPGVVPA